MASKELSLPSGAKAQVLVGGDESAQPIVYLHSAAGIFETDPFLLGLAERYRVYAPVVPGINDLEDLKDIETIQDMALYYDDLLRELGLNQAAVVGHSFGGMIAAELAAHNPDLVGSLVLISPVGLWNEAYPVLDLFATPPLELGNYLWGDPDSEAAKNAMAAAYSEAGADVIELTLRTVKAMVVAGKFMMPIPDQGLSRRLYRITMPTLLVWGDKDSVVPVEYVKDFERGIAGAKKVIIKGSGHMVAQEHTQETIDAIAAHVC